MLTARNTLHALVLAALPVASSAAAHPDMAPGDLRMPPAAHCLDARGVRQMEQAEPGAIGVLGGTGQAWRIDFTEPCGEVNEAVAVRLEAPQGWACGRAGERLIVDGRVCAVSSVKPIDSRMFADIARESRRQFAATLPTITVTGTTPEGRTPRRFKRSSAFCFATRNVRSWSEDGTGVVVETNPRRNGGHRYYRVELGGSCILAGTQSVNFQSGFQNGLICGNPGDLLVAAGSGLENDARFSTARFARMGCPVLAVYPRD